MARKMKDSGIEWIGEIPEDWKLIQLKHYCNVNNGKEVGVEIEKDDLEAIDVFGSGGVFKYTNKHLYDGEAVLFGRKGTLGKPIYVNQKFWTVDTMYYLTFANNLYPKFNYYQLCAFDWKPYITQTALPSVVAAQIVSCKLAFPIYEEQEKIVSFLDEKVAEIDNIILKTKESIEGYKKLKQSVINEVAIKGLNKRIAYKKSDIEFVDAIPEHWVEMKNNFLFRENVRPYCEGDVPLSLSQVDGLIPTADMKESSLKTASYDNWKKVVVGDLVLNRFKAHLGVLFASTLEGMVSFHYGVYEPQRKLVTKYYEYLYHSDYYKAIYAGMSNGMVVGLQNLSNVNFYAVKSLYPPYEEQVEIVTYLDERCAEIETLIAKKEAFIEEMEAYKKSLIYEYVTGKKEV